MLWFETNGIVVSQFADGVSLMCNLGLVTVFLDTATAANSNAIIYNCCCVSFISVADEEGVFV